MEASQHHPIHTGSPYHWVRVTDDNGNFFHAETNAELGSEVISAWVRFDKESGFGNNVGEITFKQDLHRRPDGSYGVGGG